MDIRSFPTLNIDNVTCDVTCLQKSHRASNLLSCDCLLLQYWVNSLSNAPQPWIQTYKNRNKILHKMFKMNTFPRFLQLFYFYVALQQYFFPAVILLKWKGDKEENYPWCMSVNWHIVIPEVFFSKAITRVTLPGSNKRPSPLNSYYYY